MEDQAIELEALERLLINTSEVPTILSYAVIKSITENFSKRIGRGGFGEVFLGTLRNGKVAVKKLSTSLDIDDKLFVDEVSCLRRVNHKNIVRFLGYCADTRSEVMEVNGRCVMVDAVRQRLLCFEYVPYGGLDNYLKDNNVYGSDWHTRCKIIKGICLGLQYLHKQHITHLDLKPENVLLDADMEPKITDFGLSRCFDDKKSRIVTENIRGTLGYMAPELLKGGEISFKTDIYSLGVIMRKLAECNIHSTDNSNKELDVDCIPTKKLIEIAQSCVDTEQRNRPTIDKIIDDIETIIKTIPSPSRNEFENVPGSPMFQINQSASRELLHVHPHKLCYRWRQNKRMLSTVLQMTNKTDDIVAFMFISTGECKHYTPYTKGCLFPRSTLGILLEFHGGEQLAQEMQLKDMIIVRSTIVNHFIKSDDITYDSFNKQTFVHDVKLDIFFDVPYRPRSLLHEFDKLQLAATTNEACADSIKTELLDIYPFQLRFIFRPNIIIDDTINLINNTDEDISFWIIPYNPRLYLQLATSFCCVGTLPARSTCALVLSIRCETKPTFNKDTLEILMAPSSSLSQADLARISDYAALKQCFFETVREKRCKAHMVYLFSDIKEPDPTNTLLPIEGILTDNFGEMTSMDVDPTQARIVTGHPRYICIWKGNEQGYALEKSLKYLSHTGMGSVARFLATIIARVSVVKFIPRRQWILSGDSAGFIDVYTAELAVLVVRFNAHGSGIRSLAVHPSHSYVLSSSDDQLIKLWDWDKGWMCSRVFPGHPSPVVQLAFEKNDTDTFASISISSQAGPGNLKIWNLHSAVPKTDIKGSVKAVDYGVTIDGRQHITVLTDRGSEIWDPQIARCVYTFMDFWNRDINVVVCHPTLPLIFTGANSGIISIWNLTTFRREFMCSLSFGGVITFGFIDTMGYKRLVIGCSNRVVVLDIDLQALAGDQ